MSEPTEEPMVCDDCGGTLTDADLFSMALGEERPHYWHMDQSGCIASLNERLTAATKRAEAAEAKYGVANECHEHALRLYKKTLTECEALRKDAARLDFLADELVFEGFAHSPPHVFELESIVAEQSGRSEPTQADRREAFRRVIDAALAVQPTTGDKHE